MLRVEFEKAVFTLLNEVPEGNSVDWKIDEELILTIHDDRRRGFGNDFVISLYIKHEKALDELYNHIVFYYEAVNIVDDQIVIVNDLAIARSGKGSGRKNWRVANEDEKALAFFKLIVANKGCSA